MFNNSQNNSQKTSVNTRVNTLYCDSSCLQIGLWDSNLSIKFNVAKGKNAEGIVQYDFDNRISTAIVPDKAAVLLKYIEENILPEISKVAAGGTLAETISFGFSVGKAKTSCLAIEYANDEAGVPSVYLALYSNIDQSGKTADAVKYKFNKADFVQGYNNTSGSYEEDKRESEFMGFVQILKNLPSVQGYSYHTTKLYEANAIKYAQNSNFGGNTQQTNSYSAPVTTMSGSGDDYPF